LLASQQTKSYGDRVKLREKRLCKKHCHAVLIMSELSVIMADDAKTVHHCCFSLPAVQSIYQKEILKRVKLSQRVGMCEEVLYTITTTREIAPVTPGTSLSSLSINRLPLSTHPLQAQSPVMDVPKPAVLAMTDTFTE